MIVKRPASDLIRIEPAADENHDQTSLMRF